MLLLVVVKSKGERQPRSSCKLYILSPYKGVFTCPTIFAQGENRMLGTSFKSEAQQQQRSNARAHTQNKQNLYFGFPGFSSAVVSALLHFK